MKPKFKSTKNEVVIIDPIERGRYSIETNTPVSLKSTTTTHIPYPMDTAVQVTTSGFTISSNNTVYVRNADGQLLTEIRPSERVDLPHEEYILDISDELKVYAHVQSAVQVHISNQKINVEFEELSTTTISARSYHTRPAATIKTTSDPVDMMKAISLFASALKTTGAERSYPTHRGHPPAIALSDEFDIPDGLDQPNTGVQIEIPPTLRHIFVVAPLAYYLAADVVPGSTPRIVTENGFSYSLTECGFESTVEQVLKQTFLLDCIVRTEGSTPLQLYERKAIESMLEFSIEDLYDRSMAEQLEAYLNVPFSEIESYIPDWHLETRLRPIPEHIEFLPFAIADLGIITTESADQSVTTVQTNTRTKGQTFLDNRIDSNIPERRENFEEKYKVNAGVTTAPQIWSQGTGSKITSTTPLSAFHNGFNQTPQEGPLEIEVVCNDPAMNEELVSVHSTYGDYDGLSFDVSIHHDLTKRELSDVLAQESDFLHYIGHIETGGFRCADGIFDAGSIEEVGTKAFLLNACQSHEQGIRLIEAGSIGGIVTLEEITNSEAVRIGRTVSYLLNRGYSLYAALDITQMENRETNNYHIVGDGREAIAQSETGAKNVCSVEHDGDQLELMVISYAGPKKKRGGLFNPYIESVEDYFVVPSKIGPFSVTKAQFLRFTNLEEMPILLDGELHWSDDIKASDL